MIILGDALVGLGGSDVTHRQGPPSKPFDLSLGACLHDVCILLGIIMVQLCMTSVYTVEYHSV